MSFEYRLARPENADVICQFQIAMAWETEKMHLDPETCMRGVLGVFEVPTRGTYYVAEENGKVIASTLVVPEWSDWRNGDVWWIHSVYVVPEQRGKRVFAGLYRFIRAEVERRPDLRGLRLYVEKKNAAARAVYRKLGMTDEHYDLFEWMKS